MPEQKPLDQFGELQMAVLEAVWDLGEATVHQVRDRLVRGKPLAYTTVLSAMQKLERQGWLAHRSEGRVYVYRATRSRERAGACMLQRFTSRLFKGDPLEMLQHFIDSGSLSKDDLAELRRMIDQRRKEIGDGTSTRR